MTWIFTLANNKGGVTKTTTTVNLAYGLAQSGRRVLVIDTDAGVELRKLSPAAK